MKVRVRRKKIGIPAVESVFTEEALIRTGKDLKSGRWPSERVRFADDVVPGLRAVVSQSGLVTYHAQYEVDGKKERRGYMKIGSANKDEDDYLPLNEARQLVKTIKGLADKGIDVQDGLHKRLLRELTDQGTDWRPAPAKRARKIDAAE